MSQVHTSLEARARKIVEALGGTWSRSRGMCCCPAHADRTPSLSITLGKRAILVHCFAGCANEAVIEGMAKLGVRISDLFDGPGGGHASEPRKEVADGNALRLWREAAILASSPAMASSGGFPCPMLLPLSHSPKPKNHWRSPLPERLPPGSAPMSRSHGLR